MEVTSRAPGKIILSGEHVVAHGSNVVAASIDLYTTISLHIPKFSWSIKKIKDVLPDLGNPLSFQPQSCSHESMKSIASLMYTLIHGYKPDITIVTSTLPLGSGLGSSASFCVSLSATLISLTSDGSIDFGHKGWLSFREENLELVNKWAYEGEKIIYGKPSGIDNTVSTFDNMIIMPVRMLITNTKVGRNTNPLFAGVSERTLRHPEVMIKELSSIIQSDVVDPLSLTEKEKKMEELMEMNQGLLQYMGVSHASMEIVLRTTLKYELSFKLTGVGGGGCVLTLLPTFLQITSHHSSIDTSYYLYFICIMRKILIVYFLYFVLGSKCFFGNYYPRMGTSYFSLLSTSSRRVLLFSYATTTS
ncbi:hypothetical protein MKX01_008342 [Papaver californicum]|nr:hypothetical protein MKX01_008342 [Papaver californicum]